MGSRVSGLLVKKAAESHHDKYMYSWIVAVVSIAMDLSLRLFG